MLDKRLIVDRRKFTMNCCDNCERQNWRVVTVIVTSYSGYTEPCCSRRLSYVIYIHRNLANKWSSFVLMIWNQWRTQARRTRQLSPFFLTHNTRNKQKSRQCSLSSFTLGVLLRTNAFRGVGCFAHNYPSWALFLYCAGGLAPRFPNPPYPFQNLAAIATSRKWQRTEMATFDTVLTVVGVTCQLVNVQN